MKRIRYNKTSTPNVIQSVKTYQHPDNGAQYKILINQESKEYRVVEDMSNTTVNTGRATNLHQVKIKAKDALIALGVTFAEKEIRTTKSS